MIINDGDEMEQAQMPLLEALKRHINLQPISLHVPGHKNGLLIDEEYRKGILKFDVTELSGLDDLHSPEDAIFKAEKLLAEAYNVEKSYFLVNGTTVGNLAMILATLEKNDIVFIQRNCHKSILNGIELAGAIPILLQPEYITEWGVTNGITLQTLQAAFHSYPNCKAVILTYPNYYGMTYALEDLIQYAHERGIPVLIDEAHGAHFRRSNFTPASSIELGADIVVQSAHKTLPAMTMGSFLHLNSDLVSREKVNSYLRILQSSSPSYPIMVSLDYARSYYATYTREDERYTQGAIQLFKNDLNTIKQFSVLNYPNDVGDPLKLTLQTRCHYTGFEMQRLFEEYGVYTEMADLYNVVLVLPLLKKDMSFPFNEIVARMKNALRNIPIQSNASLMDIHYDKTMISTLHNGSYLQINDVLLEESPQHISAETIIPYPPGIPLLQKGEMISKESINLLLQLKDAGAKIQGGEGLKEGKIKVFFSQNGGFTE